MIPFFLGFIFAAIKNYNVVMRRKSKIRILKRVLLTLCILWTTCSISLGQGFVVSGVVKDAQGVPMPGVAVVLKVQLWEV